MNSFKINITTEEAALIVAALGFVEDNLTLDPVSLKWQFVPGKPFNLSLDSAGRLCLLKGYIEEAQREAIETHPFNPFIKTL